MVEESLHPLLDVGEIFYHAVAVFLRGGQVHGYRPVVPVQPAALALITQFEPVAGRNLHRLGYAVYHRCCVSVFAKDV